ncbi:MAG: double-strand break repair protein AddB [Paracoccaceae bacterium]
MFSPQSSPRVFALPLGVDFSQALIAGLLERLKGTPPEALARVVIYVNTRRFARRLEAILCESNARLLPDIRVITDLAYDETMPMPPATPPLRRRLIIARLIAEYVRLQPDLAPSSAVFDLADSLGTLLDGFQGEGVAMAALRDIDVAGQSDHWQRALQFLNILDEYWNHHRPNNAPDPEERQRAIAESYARMWETSPPDHPVIIAGSTGSRGATTVFMRAVANLPQGAVILPGFDYDLPDLAWENTSADHPQYGFRHLADTLDFPLNPPQWHAQLPVNAARNKLVSLALRPAPVTDQWLKEGPELAETLSESCGAITLIEAPNPRAEAEAIAIRLRRAVHDNQKAALVTPDRILARRVASVLRRWEITPDDSAGRPLPLTPPGVFLRRLISLASAPLTPEGLLAVLKHPLCGGIKTARTQHLRMTRKLEIEVLRGGAPFIIWRELEDWAKTKDDTHSHWLAWLRASFTPILKARADLPLAEWLKLHRDTAEGLSGGLTDEPCVSLWEKEAGKKACATFETLEHEAAHGGVIPIVQYRALFQSELNRGEVREDAYRPHPDVMILGTLEARVQTADLVILGGLNEGIWPRVPAPDPWMSRDMRRQIGLPLPERQIGLSAHDFQQAISAPNVVLSRAIRDGEAPTVASRWLIRLLNLLNGLGSAGTLELHEMRKRGVELLALSDALNTPKTLMPAAQRPSPSPPISKRPERLSVTRIETLIRDPYAIYASEILKLRALAPPGKEADARARGTVLHKVMEVFLHETTHGLPDDPEAAFLEVARKVLKIEVPWPSTRRLWMARLQKITPWFIATEHQRRERAAPLAQERKGIRRMQSGFTLSAKADRIDLLAGGSYAIYDYKSGGLPTGPQIKNFAVQLPLEGAIAQAGGFEGLAPSDIAHLELIGLGSGGKCISLNLSDEDIAGVWAKLVTLIDAFSVPDLGYTARARPEQITYASDYDHLSRFGEWHDGDPFDIEVIE